MQRCPNASRDRDQFGRSIVPALPSPSRPVAAALADPSSCLLPLPLQGSLFFQIHSSFRRFKCDHCQSHFDRLVDQNGIGIALRVGSRPGWGEKWIPKALMLATSGESYSPQLAIVTPRNQSDDVIVFDDVVEMHSSRCPQPQRCAERTKELR